MSAKLLDGKAFAAQLKADAKARAAAVKKARGRAPSLAVVFGSPDPAAAQYRREQLKACAAAGIEAVAHQFPSDRQGALALLAKLGADPLIDAVIVEQPVPEWLTEDECLEALPAAKDAEGVSVLNFGRLMRARRYEDAAALPLPCTAAAVVSLLRWACSRVDGREAVVVGRSNIVGKPVAHLLSLLGATVTLCHSHTSDLQREVERAEIVVAAIGKPGHIRAHWLKEGAFVLDAGTTFVNGKLRGDVEDAARERPVILSPVPGGVGPVTTAVLLSNVVRLAEARLTAAA